MDIATLRLQRGQLKAAGTRMKNFLIYLDADNSKTSQLSSRFENYKKTMDQFNDIQNAIEGIDSDEIISDERAQFKDMYFDIVAQCSGLLEVKSSNVNNMSHVSSPQIGLRLPKIELPRFDGDYADWLNFGDLFSSMVHENETLNSVQKLHYLKSCLKNNDAQIMAPLPTIASNYCVAWQLIKERFNNPKILIKTHVDNILDVASVQRESAASVHTLSDSLSRDVTALKSLNQPVDYWSMLLVLIVERKLDFSTRSAWELQNSTYDDPSFGDLQTFLRERAQFLENLQSKPAQEKSRTKPIAKSLIARKEQCNNCSKEHKIQTCDTFLDKAPSDRFNRVKELKLCINCLQPNHTVSNCKSSNCRKCGKRHHTLLHLRSKAENLTHDNKAQSSPEKPSVNSLSCHQMSSSSILLSTAKIQIMQPSQQRTAVRTLLDSGRQTSFITEELCTRLNLPTKQQGVTIIGIGNSQCNLQKSVTLQLKSLYNNYHFHVSAYVIPEIVSNMPSSSFCSKSFQMPTHIQLADPSFNKSSSIDILLGANILYSLLSAGQIKLGRTFPTLQKTVLGWVVSGNIPSATPNTLA